MKILLGMFLLISLPSFGQRNYIIPIDYFINQFSDTNNLYRVYCLNKKGIKVWLTNVGNSIVTFKLKEGNPDEILLYNPKYKNGIIEGTGLKTIFKKAKLYTINIKNVLSIAIESTYSVETKYFNIDSCRYISKYKNDSLIKKYSSGKQFVIYIKPKINFKIDTLTICENACYNIVFADGNFIKNGVVESITKDSIYISNSFNINTARKNKIEYKILKYKINDIAKLKLLKGGYSFENLSIKDADLITMEQEKNILFIPCWYQVNSFSGDIELFRDYLTFNGFAGVKELDGNLYWNEK